jgi:hypothetical protein
MIACHIASAVIHTYVAVSTKIINTYVDSCQHLKNAFLCFLEDFLR